MKLINVNKKNDWVGEAVPTGRRSIQSPARMIFQDTAAIIRIACNCCFQTKSHGSDLWLMCPSGRIFHICKCQGQVLNEFNNWVKGTKVFTKQLDVRIIWDMPSPVKDTTTIQEPFFGQVQEWKLTPTSNVCIPDLLHFSQA